MSGAAAQEPQLTADWKLLMNPAGGAETLRLHVQRSYGSFFIVSYPVCNVIIAKLKGIFTNKIMSLLIKKI